MKTLADAGERGLVEVVMVTQRSVTDGAPTPARPRCPCRNGGGFLTVDRVLGDLHIEERLDAASGSGDETFVST